MPPTAPILDNNVKQKVEKPTAPFAPKVNPKMEGKEGKPNTSVVVNNPPNLKSSTSSPEPQNGVSTSENTEGSSDKSGKIEVRIFALEKGTNGSISGAKVSVVDMNLIKNSLVVTDASGKIIGLRTEHGDALPLETLQKLEETTDATGKITVQLPSGNRFLFNFTKTGFEPKFILKTVLPNDSKIVAFLSALPKVAVTTTKALRKSRDTTPPTIYYRESVRVRADNFDDQAQFTANENVGSSDKTSVSSSDGFTFELKKIYYDYGDSEVNADAKLELEPLIDLMLRHREVEIEIASHTDSRGKAPFNLNLSQQRADNLKVYLTERGIRASRIRAVGYGETQLKNGCVDGVNCSEEDHAKNRRTEIRILKGAETERINEQHLNESKPPKPVKTTKAGNDTEGVNFYADASTQPAKLAAEASAHRWFMVVIGTFTKPDNAALQRQKALDAGFEDAELVQYQDNALYGVCVRKYNNEKEAKSLVERINEAKQFEAFVKELK